MGAIRKVITPLLILALILMPVSELISFNDTEPDQEEGLPVVIHKKVGRSIDIKERDYYKLFLLYENFQSATVFQLDDKSHMLRIIEKEKKKNGKQYSRRLRFLLEQATLFKLQSYIVQFEKLAPDDLDSFFTPQEKAILGIKEIKKEESKAMADQRKVQGDLALVRSKGNAVADSQKVQDGLVLVRTNENDYRVISDDSVKRADILSGKRKWKFKIRTEKGARSQLSTGRYRSSLLFRISPWAGINFPRSGEAAAIFGGRFRLYFTRRYGLELSYGISSWSYEGWSGYKINRTEQYLSGRIFISFTRGWLINPFITWGLGCNWMKGRKIYWDDVAINLYLGIEIPIKSWLSLDIRGGDVWEIFNEHHLGVQCGITVGFSY